VQAPEALGTEAADRHAPEIPAAEAADQQGAGTSAAEPTDPHTENSDFRVENSVFIGSQREPVSTSVTIFHDGSVYDFLASPDEVVVFEPAEDRLVLLDLERHIRTELNTTEVEQFSQRLKQWAGQQRDPLLRFLGAPEFSEQFDEVRGELVLSSPWLTYHILLADAPSPAVCQQYRRFCDWMARLNTLLKANARPPFARLLANEAIARHGAIPREVRLTIARSGLPLPRQVLRSEHRFYQAVVGPDLDRVVQAQQFMHIFKRVDFQEYRRAPDD